MGVMRSAVFAMVLLFIGTHLLAQSNQNTPAEPTGTSSAQATMPTSMDQIPGIPPGSHPVVRGPQHDRRCWREAGIAPAKVNERWKVEDGAQVKINAVCSEASLTPEKKSEKVHEIHLPIHEDVAKSI